jgi:hypothetical protein
MTQRGSQGRTTGSLDLLTDIQNLRHRRGLFVWRLDSFVVEKYQFSIQQCRQQASEDGGCFNCALHTGGGIAQNGELLVTVTAL